MKTFPPFRLDSANECLWRGNTRILLPPKVFAVLEYLVRHAGRLVPQDELLAALWPDTFVQPEVLRKYILEIRKVLDDPARQPRFVETVPRRGYRFIASVIEESGSPAGSENPGRLPRLVGREAPMAELKSHFVASLEGHRRIVFITGEAGIGKTSLTDAFEQSVAGEAVYVVRGQCVEGFGGKEAYYPVLDALGGLMKGDGGETVVETVAEHAPTWLIQFPSFVQPKRKDKLQHELLGATRERMVREFCDVIETLTSRKPLVMILEDLQWADNPTLDIISAIARRRGSARFLLLGTYRSADVTLARIPLIALKRDLRVRRLCAEINLGGLAEADVAAYLTAAFSPGIGPDLASLVYRLSDGNPLFMMAILDRLQQSGLIRRENGGWTAALPARELELDIPETLQQMLQIQLEQLTPRELQLLRAGSVAGGRFPVWVPAALLELEPEQVEESCEEFAMRHQFLKRVGAAESGSGEAFAEYEFRHILYREVLYRQLGPAQRHKLHLRVARRMEEMSAAGDTTIVAGLAFHFEQGHDFEKAIQYLLLTAENAVKRYAHSEAIHLLQHTLDLLSHIPMAARKSLEPAILGRISDSLYASGEMHQSADIDHKAADLAARYGDRTAQVHALTREARCLAFIDPSRCVDVCDKAVAVSRGLNDPLLQARAEMLASSWHIVTNGWKQDIAATCAEARSRLFQLSSELPAYYEILYAHVQCIQGEYSDALVIARAGISQAVADDNLAVYLSAHSSMTHALLHLGEWAELTQVIARSQEIAGKNGNTPWLRIFQALRGWLHFQACDYDRAVALAQNLLAADTTGPPGQAQVMAMVTRACAEIELGSPDSAIEALTSICDRPAEPRFFMDWYWRMIARLALAGALEMTGDRTRAAAEAAKGLALALATADPHLKALAWELNARIHAGDPNCMSHSLEQAFAALAGRELPIAAWRVHRTASQLWAPAGDAARSEYHRKQASAILRQLAAACPPSATERAALQAAARQVNSTV